MKLFNKINTETRVSNGLLLFKGLLIALFISFSLSTSAQCKRYTKKYCFPSLNPYMHNGQLTSTTLNPGDSADVLMTFNAGKEYRILACSQEQVGGMQFRVLDKSRKVIYESRLKDNNPYWDFKVENTQQLIIQLTTVKAKRSIEKTNMIPAGCVSLLVGFKN